MRLASSFLAVLVAMLWMSSSVAQDRPVVLVEQFAWLPALQDNSGLDDLEIVNFSSSTADCTPLMDAIPARAQNHLNAVISERCAEVVGQLASQHSDIVFVTGGDKVAGLPSNVVQLTLPDAFVGLAASARTEFETGVPLSVCGSPLQPSGGGLFACLSPPAEAADAQTITQLHFRSALNVLRTLKSNGSLANPSSVWNSLNGVGINSALGQITFDSQGVAAAALPVELTWRPEDKSQASTKFQNASADEILQFLKDNLDPASAGVSKTCGTTCPTSCNGNCEKSGNEQCCKVASHELPLN